MSKAFRTKRNNAQSTKGDDMTDAVAEPKVVHESKKVKPVEHEGVKVETQTVDATFGKIEGSINYPRCTALTADGALAIAGAQKLTKTVKGEDGKDAEVDQTDEEKFLKYFNAGYDAAMRIIARNELAIIVEGPEKQINAIALRIAKFKSFEGSEDEMIAKVKALPEFNTLVSLMA